MKNKILPVFITFAGCTSRCIYCNQSRITGIQPSEILQSAENQIKECLAMGVEWTELAFYGGSFSCLPSVVRSGLYKLAETTGIARLRYSTSPDCIDESVLEESRVNGVKTVELGVQSLDDEVLRLNKRPYTADECINAFGMVKSNIETTGIQLMVGMHGETPESFYKTIESALLMGADYARIYPTVVLEETQLAELWQSGDYKPVSLHDAVARCAYGYILLTASGCSVIRIGLHDSDGVKSAALAGAYHPAMGEMAKTVAVQTFYELGGVLGLDQQYLNIAYGYGSVLKKVCRSSLELIEGEKPDFEKICRYIVEKSGEDHKRKLQEQTAGIAKRLFG